MYGEKGKTMSRYWTIASFGLAVLVAMASVDSARAQTTIGASLGLSFTKGVPYGGYPYGYGYGGGAFGGYGMPCGGVSMPYAGNYGMGGGFGGGGFGMPFGGMTAPAIPPLSAPMPYIPPHLAQGNLGWGGGYGSLPGPGFVPGGAGCGACMAGYPQMPISPVAGGPALAGSCGGLWGTCGANGGIGLPGGIMGGGGIAAGGGAIQGGASGVFSANGTTVIDMRSRNAWEIPDTGEIVWATALGLGMQATNVYPVAIPRYQPTYFGTPSLYSTGGREYDFYARPHTQ